MKFLLFYDASAIFSDLKIKNRFINAYKLFYWWEKYQKFMKKFLMLPFSWLKT